MNPDPRMVARLRDEFPELFAAAIHRQNSIGISTTGLSICATSIFLGGGELDILRMVLDAGEPVDLCIPGKLKGVFVPAVRIYKLMSIVGPIFIFEKSVETFLHHNCFF